MYIYIYIYIYIERERPQIDRIVNYHIFLMRLKVSIRLKVTVSPEKDGNNQQTMGNKGGYQPMKMRISTHILQPAIDLTYELASKW